MAQQLSPQVIQARGRSRSASADVRSAWGSFLPSLSLSAGANRQYPSGERTRVENGQIILLSAEPWSYQGNLGANLDLFTGGSRWFDLQQAKQTQVSAQSNETTQRYAVALAVKQQFYNVLAAR